MSRKYPFYGQQSGPLGSRAQRRAAKKKQRGGGFSSGYSAPGNEPWREDSLRKLRLPMVTFEPQCERKIYAFYDSLDERAEFLTELEQFIRSYISSTPRPLSELRLGLTGIDLPQLEQICEEECCDTELFVQCHFLEIYKICPADVVVASGAESQKLLQELKKLAHDRPDGGARFLTLAEVLESSGRSSQEEPDRSVLESSGRKGDLRDPIDRAAYFSAIVERLYA